MYGQVPWMNFALLRYSKLIYDLQFKVLTVMPLEHDYDETIMCETIPHITIPTLNPPTITPINSSRYQKELFSDLEKLMLEEKQREDKRIHLLKEKQQHIGQQVQRRLADKERKIREIQQEQKKKLYSECTFKPKTIVKGQRRSLNEFLHQQEEFTKKINQKRTALKQNLEAEKNKDTFHPKTNPKMKNSSKRNEEGTVFQRLYALKDKENDQFNQQERTEPTFQPTITEKSKKMTRNAPIDNLLYSDALRRQQKARDLQSSANFRQPIKYQKCLNEANQKYVAQKFIREYCDVVQTLGIPSETDYKIEYMLFNQILKIMCFVQVEEDNQNSYERTLIHEAYLILQKYQVNARNVCVFLLAIIGIFHINPINFSDPQTSDPDKEFALDEVEGRRLQKYFDLFKRNRLYSESNKKYVDNEKEDYSYHPKINKASQQMAVKHRGQMLDEFNKLLTIYPELDCNIPEDGVIEVTDLLVLNNLAKDIKVQRLKEQIEKKQMEECTFKPTTISNSMTQTLNNSKISSAQGNLGHKKSLELYNFHRNLQSKKESLQASRQSEDIKLKECTFSPNIVHPKVTTDKTKFNSKDVEQTLFRMKKGREQAEDKKNFLERGQKQPKREKQYYSMKEPTRLRESKSEEQLPILFLDINLGERKEKIILYHGDEDRLEQVAHDFAHKNNLDSENERKLCELLKIELESILMKIEEDEESEENIEQ